MAAKILKSVYPNASSVSYGGVEYPCDGDGLFEVTTAAHADALVKEGQATVFDDGTPAAKPVSTPAKK